MNVRVSVAESIPANAAAVGHLVFEGLVPASSEVIVTKEVADHRSFSGKVGESLVESEDGRLRVLVGAGSEESFSARELRRAAAIFARAVAGCPEACLDLSAQLPGGLGTRQAVQVATEGLAGATYCFSNYRSTPRPLALESAVIRVVAGEGEEAAAGLKRGLATANAVALARDLGNTPAADMTPSRLAEIAEVVADASGLELKVLDDEEISAERLGGLLGVARGSDEPPRLIKLTYVPDGAGADVPTVALVGKGITFDSGGLSLKSGDGMMTMKDDMSGAAAVIATLGACREADVKVRVIGFAPCTENMPSGKATKPGDILTTRNGKTIEVLNTDAEGRLVLADGLALAAEEQPDAIVDVATLTGACVVALGSDVAGVMGNDSRVVAALRRASETAGEPIWHLPLPQAYRKNYESEVADMKNIGRPGNAGALVAGLILEEFVGDRPWAHLDIAGPAFTDDDSYDRRKGSTGFGVRTLIEFVSSYEAIGSPADRAADGSVR